MGDVDESKPFECCCEGEDLFLPGSAACGRAGIALGIPGRGGLLPGLGFWRPAGAEE